MVELQQPAPLCNVPERIMFAIDLDRAVGDDMGVPAREL